MGLLWPTGYLAACTSSQTDSNLVLELPHAYLQLLQHLRSICRMIVICLESCYRALEAIWSMSTALPLMLCCSMAIDTCCSLCIPLEGLKRWLQGTRAACHARPGKDKGVALSGRASRQQSSAVHPATVQGVKPLDQAQCFFLGPCRFHGHGVCLCLFPGLWL